MQIDGYSLNAQKTKIKAFCDYNEYEIASEYEDAGKSGKSIGGRIAFNAKVFTEAVINAFVHNKWVNGNGPMFTSFRNRIEILSRGTLPPKQTVDEFYAGESVPVNEALSKIFIQLHITEHTGRGIPQITSVYGRDNIRINENNIVVTIPFDRLEDTTYTSEIQDDAQVKSENAQVNAQVNVKHVQVETQNNDVNLEEKVIQFCSEAKSIIEICDYLGFKDRRTVRKILNPLLELSRLAMTVPDKPNSRNQKYISIK